MKPFRIVCSILFLASSVAALAQTESEEKACRADYEKYCSHVWPGGGRILSCLRKEEAKLSEACQKVLKAHAKDE